MRIFTNIHNPQIVDMDMNPISIGADMPQPIIDKILSSFIFLLVIVFYFQYY